MQTNGKPARNSFVKGFSVKGDTLATYCIRIVGELEERWLKHIGELKIKSSYQVNEKTITTFFGHLPDHIALFGVIKSLYDLRLPPLSVLTSCSETEPTSIPMPTASPYAPTTRISDAPTVLTRSKLTLLIAQAIKK